MTEKIDVEHLLQEGKSVHISPEGYSMYPLIIPGRDSVLLEPFVKQRDRVRRGDILLYRRETGLLVVHRVHRITPDGRFIFCGDNQSELEGPLNARQVLGKVTRITRRGREFSVKHPLYRLYSWFWILTRRLRPTMHVVAEAFRKVFAFFGVRGKNG